MAELISSISSAIAIVKNHRELSDKLKNAELKGLLADLNVELAEVKMRLADVLQENTELKAQARAMQTPTHDPCPRCGKRTWSVHATRPDPNFGDMGGSLRTYKCSECGLSEEKFYH
jgi:hypothetical protein